MLKCMCVTLKCITHQNVCSSKSLYHNRIIFHNNSSIESIQLFPEVDLNSDVHRVCTILTKRENFAQRVNSSTASIVVSSRNLGLNVLPAILNINIERHAAVSSHLQICTRNRNKRSVSFMKSVEAAYDQRWRATGGGSRSAFPLPPMTIILKEDKEISSFVYMYIMPTLAEVSSTTDALVILRRWTKSCTRRMDYGIVWKILGCRSYQLKLSINQGWW